MNILKELQDIDNLAPSEQIIRSFVLKEQEDIENYTIGQLADILFVSKSTFVRFSKKMGYSGWDEFKKAYLKALAISYKSFTHFDYNFPFTENDSPINIANKLRIIKEGTIEETFSYLEPQALKACVQLLSTQNQIHIFGEGYSRLATQDFSFRMTRTGKFVSNNFEEGLLYIAKTLTPNDLAIVVSYTGKTESVLKFTQILSKMEVPIISITTKDTNPVAQLANHSFYLPSEEDTYDKISNFATVDAMRYIFDVIFSAYFNQNFTKNLSDRVAFAKKVHIK